MAAGVAEVGNWRSSTCWTLGVAAESELDWHQAAGRRWGRAVQFEICFVVRVIHAKVRYGAAVISSFHSRVWLRGACIGGWLDPVSKAGAGL